MISNHTLLFLGIYLIAFGLLTIIVCNIAKLWRKQKSVEETLPACLSFEDTVRAMTGKQIVQAMIDGLEKRWVNIDMQTYGNSIIGSKVCFGCAATNTVCQIENRPFPSEYISSREDRAVYLNSSQPFLYQFESAINWLRQGMIERYNLEASDIGIAELPYPKTGFPLPTLENGSYQDNLVYYQEYANTLE